MKKRRKRHPKSGGDMYLKNIVKISLFLVLVLGVSIFVYFQKRITADVSQKQKFANVVAFKASMTELKAEVEEGQRTEVELALKNEGGKAAKYNLYKVDNLGKTSSQDKKIDNLLNYKNKKLAKVKDKTANLRKAALFTGAPWLSMYPFFGVLAGGSESKVKLSVVADNLAPGEYKTSLVLLGDSTTEKMIIPITITVKPSFKPRYSKVEIDDGFSSGTSGNKNHKADPGETVKAIFTLENKSQAAGDNLKVQISLDDTLVIIMSSNIKQIASVGAKNKFSAQYILKISDKAQTNIPPIVNLTTTDNNSHQWVENGLYLGETGTFQYPGGLIKSKK